MPRPEHHKSESLTAAEVTRRGPKSIAAVRVPVTPAPPPAVTQRGRALAIAAARRYSPRPDVTHRGPPSESRPLTAARRGLTRRGPPHSPRPESLAAAQVTSRLAVIQARRGPGHSQRPAITRRGRPSFTNLSHSPQRRPSRPPRLKVTCRDPSPT